MVADFGVISITNDADQDAEFQIFLSICNDIYRD